MKQTILEEFSNWLFWNNSIGFEDLVDEYIKELENRNVQTKKNLKDFKEYMIDLYAKNPKRFWHNPSNICDLIDLVYNYDQVLKNDIEVEKKADKLFLKVNNKVIKESSDIVAIQEVIVYQFGGLYKIRVDGRYILETTDRAKFKKCFKNEFIK